MLLGTRPDIIFATNFLARYAHEPTVHHLHMAKTLLRYLSATSDHSLHYPATNGQFKITAYSDADWAGAHDSRSTSGILTMVNGTALTWYSKKQSTVAMSTAEAEYISAAECGLEIVWLRTICEDFGFKQQIPTSLLLDNKSAIQMATNASNHSRTKHIKLRYHKLRELIDESTLSITYIPSQDQLADIFTKALPRDRLNSLKSAIGLLNSSQLPLEGEYQSTYTVQQAAAVPQHKSKVPLQN